MTTIRRSPFDPSSALVLPSKKRLASDWPTSSSRKKRKSSVPEQSHCHVYLRLFPSTLKCSIDVLVHSQKDISSPLIDTDRTILIGQTRLAKSIEANVVRVRLVSSLFSADLDVNEDPTMTKLETIRRHRHLQFDKQFALILKVMPREERSTDLVFSLQNRQLGPGVIGKVLIEALDPLTGSYTTSSPIFELNLHLSDTHCIGFVDTIDQIEQVEIAFSHLRRRRH